jgi:16S rRNA processing protein RimM
MSKDDCYELGRVIKTHGVKGELSIYLDVDIPKEYEELDSVFVEVKGELVPYFIEDINILQNKKAIVKFEDLESIEAVQNLVGAKLFLPTEVLPELEEGQFYYHDVIGYQVIDEKLGKLGTVENFFSMPTHDMLVMVYRNKEVLIPVVSHIVVKADKTFQEVHTSLPEGLVDVYMEETKAEKEQKEQDQ